MAQHSRLMHVAAFAVIVAMLCTAASAASSCPEGNRVKVDGNCEACETANCNRCWLTASSCTLCNEGYYYTSNKTCEACPGANCKTCAPLTGTCTSCPDGYKYIPPSVGIYYPKTSTGYCESNYTKPTYKCADGYHVGATGDCTKCEPSNCKNCYVNTTYCTVCNSKYYLTSAGTCEPCPGANCLECGALTGMCIKCPAGYAFVPPNFGLVANASKYGYCNGASVVQQVVVAVAVLASFVAFAVAA